MVPRTQELIDKALEIKKKYLEQYNALPTSMFTEEELEIMNRAFVTTDTINNIRVKQINLKNNLNEQGYWGDGIFITQMMPDDYWNSYKIFTHKDLIELFEDMDKLKKAFFVFNSTPLSPNPSYRWQDWNALEQILEDLESTYTAMMADSEYKMCGIAECED